MPKFLKQPGPGVLLIAAAAVLGSVKLMMTTAPAAASHGTSHSHECPICRLPVHGPGNEPSKFGPESDASAHLIDALHRYTAPNTL
jgi:hypothetical protein